MRYVLDMREWPLSISGDPFSTVAPTPSVHVTTASLIASAKVRFGAMFASFDAVAGIAHGDEIARLKDGAKAFAGSGIEVSVASTRYPQSFASAAGAIGPEFIPKRLADAVKVDIVFLAVRFESHWDVAKVLPTWKGKTIVDVTNAYGVSLDELVDQPSAKAAAKAFTGAKLVKGFNHLVAAVLDQDPAVNGGRRVVFLASDDHGAAAERSSASRRSNSAASRKAGCSCRRGNSWGQLIFKDLVKFEQLL